MPSIRLNLTVNDDGSVTLKKFRRNARRSFKGAEKDAKSFGIAGKAALLAVAYGAFKLAKSFGGLIKDSAMMAARYETLGVVMRVVGKNAGYSAGQMESFAKGVQAVGISMIESRQAVSRLAIAQLDLARSAELARVAQNVAVVGLVDSSEAYRRLVEGIQKGSLIMLKTLGISLTFEEGYKKFADSMDRTVESLTPLEKTQSRFNQVMLYGQRYAGTYAQSMETAGKQILSLKRYVDDFRVRMGEAFGPATAKIVKRMTLLMKEWTAQVTTPEAQEKLKEMANNVADLVASMASLAKLLPSIISGMNELFSINPATYYKGIGAFKDSPELLKQFKQESFAGRKRMLAQYEAQQQAAARSNALISGPTQIVSDLVAPGQLAASIPTKPKQAAQVVDTKKLADEAFKRNAQEVESIYALEDAYKEISQAALPEYQRSVAKITAEYDNWKKVVTELESANKITTEEAKNLTDQLSIRIKEEIKDLNKVANDLGMTFASAFEDAVVAGGNLREILKGIEQDIVRILLRKTMTEPLANSLTAGINTAGTYLGGLFSGGATVGMAGGGKITEPIVGVGASGQTYSLGEGGENEWVIPESKMGGGQVINQYITVDARGADIGVETRVKNAAAKLGYNMVMADVADRGPIRQALGR